MDEKNPVNLYAPNYWKMKEATARIKINKLLELAGWRFFEDGNVPANIQLEPKVKLKDEHLSHDISVLSDHPNYSSVQTLHEALAVLV